MANEPAFEPLVEGKMGWLCVAEAGGWWNKSTDQVKALAGSVPSWASVAVNENSIVSPSSQVCRAVSLVVTLMDTTGGVPGTTDSVALWLKADPAGLVA